MYRPPEGDPPAGRPDRREVCATCANRFETYYRHVLGEEVLQEGYMCPVLETIVPANYVCADWRRRGGE